MTNCKNCGAPIKNGRCQYCGTVYDEKITLEINYKPFIVTDEKSWEQYWERIGKHINRKRGG